jgi:hypothetical protein
VSELSSDEVQLVLRRAAELEHAPPDTGGLSPDELERVGTEVGLSPAAVQRALGELRAGLLTSPGGRPIVERVVPGAPADVRRLAERYLQRQLFRVKRDFRERVVWERATGLGADLRRAFDWSGELALASAREIELTLIEAEPGRTRVRFVIDQSGLPRRLAGGASLGAIAGVLAAAMLYATGAPHMVEWLTAVGATGGGAWTGWRAYRSALDTTQNALERFLDEIEHPRPAPRSHIYTLFGW